MNGYLGPERVTYAIGPGRLAYLVRKGNRSDLLSAAATASTRWGGMSEPIVPIGPNGAIAPKWAQIVNSLQPDGATSIGLDDDLAAKCAAELSLQYTPRRYLDGHGLGVESIHPSAFKPEAAKNVFGLVSGDRRSLWQIVAAGDVDEADGPLWHGAELGITRAVTDDEIGRGQLSGATPIAFTMTGLEPLPSEVSFSPTLVHVTDGRPNDLTWFWNLRALWTGVGFGRPPMILLPEDVGPWVSFPELFRSYLRLHGRVTPDVVVYGPSLTRARVAQVADILGLEFEQSDTTSVRRGASASTLDPPAYTYRNVDPRQWVLGSRRYGRAGTTLTHVFTPSTDLEFPCPVQATSSGSVLIDISGLRAFEVPHRPAVAQLFLPAAGWRDGQLHFRTHLVDQYRFTLNLPDDHTVLRAAILGSCGATFAFSDKGRYAQAILALHDTAEFTEPRLQVLKALTTPRSTTLIRELERLAPSEHSRRDLVAIAAEWAPKRQQSYLPVLQVAERSGQSRPDAAAHLESVCELGLAERGFGLACTECLLRSFVPLASGADRATCPGCHAPQSFERSTAGPTVFYRLNGLVDQASDNGVLTQILAVVALTTPARHLLVPGADVTFPGESTSAEVDILGFIGPDLVAGEAKVSPSDFTEEQLDIDFDKSRRIGVVVHIMAAMGPITAETRTTASALAVQSGLRLAIIDPTGITWNQ